MKAAIIVSLLSSLLCAAFGLGYVVNLPNENWDYSYSYQQTPLGDNGWRYGSGTWYNFIGNTGACGHPSSVIDNYDTVAVPLPRYHDPVTPGVGSFTGAACGQCYLIKCLPVPRYGHTVFCKSLNPILVIVSDYDVPGTWNSGSWPNNHFDFQPKSFSKIANLGAGMINVKFKRTPCPMTSANWKLAADSQFFFKDVIVYGVAKTGSIAGLYIKPSSRNQYYKGKRLWGSHFTFLSGWQMDGGAKVKVVLAENKGTVLAKKGQ